MSSTPDLLEAAREVLDQNARPLSARRVHKVLADDTRFAGQRPSVAAVRDALAEAAARDDHPIREVRRGVFATGESDGDEDEDEDVEDEDEDEDEETMRTRSRENDGGNGRSRRRRRGRIADLVGDDPAAALTVDDAAADIEAADDRARHRRRLWNELRTSTAAVIGVEDELAPATPLLDDDDVAPDESVEIETGPAAEAPEPPAETRADDVDVARLVRRRLARRRETPALADAPYKEQRRSARPRPPKRERRVPRPRELEATDDLVEGALAALRKVGAPLPLSELAETLEVAGVERLRAALHAENARRSATGLRGLFAVGWSGGIGLTEWGLSKRYLALEATVNQALAEQRELVRRDLLRRVAELGDDAFEQVVLMLLEQLGHEDIEIVHRQSGRLALAADGPNGRVAVVVIRGWDAVGPQTVRRLADGLRAFDADAGLILALGVFSEAAREAAGDLPVVLLDGARLAHHLFESGVGVASHHPVVRYVDVSFFDSLE